MLFCLEHFLSSAGASCYWYFSSVNMGAVKVERYVLQLLWVWFNADGNDGVDMCQVKMSDVEAQVAGIFCICETAFVVHQPATCSQTVVELFVILKIRALEIKFLLIRCCSCLHHEFRLDTAGSHPVSEGLFG